MNKYIVPICDIQAGLVKNVPILAQNLVSAQDKLMDKLCEEYDWVNPYDFKEFKEFADTEDVLIGEIKDIEII